MLCIITLFSSTILAQSSEFLDRLKNNSELIIEGEVVDKYCVEDAKSGNIYTMNTVEVSQYLTGQLNTSLIEIKTNGGHLNGRSQVLSHSPTLSTGQKGIFFVSNLEQSYERTTCELSHGSNSIIQCFENEIDYEAVHRGQNIKYRSKNLVRTMLRDENIPIIFNSNLESEICLSIGNVRPNVENNTVEIDIMVKANQEGFLLSELNLGVSYPTGNLGNNIIENNAVSISKGIVISDPIYFLNYEDIANDEFEIRINSICSNNSISEESQSNLYAIGLENERLLSLEFQIENWGNFGALSIEDFAINGSANYYSAEDRACMPFDELCVQDGEIRLEVCEITNVSTEPYSAGTQQILTIEGTMFGDAGTIKIPNADDGGLTNITLSSFDFRYIKLWTDTRIEVLISSITNDGPPMGSGRWYICPFSGIMECGRDVDVEYAINNGYDEIKNIEQIYSIAHGSTIRSSFEWYLDNVSINQTIENNTFLNDQGVTFEKIKEICELAFCQWEEATNLEFVYMGLNSGGTANQNDNKHTIGFIDQPSGILATTNFFTDDLCDSPNENDPFVLGNLQDADISFDSEIILIDTITMRMDTLGFYVSTGLEPPSNHVDFYSVLLHEIGHAISLDHSMDIPLNGTLDERIMYFGLDPTQIKRRLDSKSIDGVKRQKEISKQSIADGCLQGFILNCSPTGCGPTSVVGLGSSFNIEMNNLVKLNGSILLESSEIINNISFFDLNGVLLQQWSNLNDKFFESDFTYGTGMYFIRIELYTGEYISKKIICHD